MGRLDAVQDLTEERQYLGMRDSTLNDVPQVGVVSAHYIKWASDLAADRDAIVDYRDDIQMLISREESDVVLNRRRLSEVALSFARILRATGFWSIPRPP